MNFKLSINVSEKDYLDYNIFWNFKSSYGKKGILKCRVLLTAIIAVVILFSLFGGGFSSSAFLGIIPYIIVLVLLQILLKPIFVSTIKGNIKSLKKKGKICYSERSVIEFFDDSFIETAPEQKSEVRYSAIERISIVSNKVIYIHVNNLLAYILPFSSFESDKQREDFISFIKEKCAKVEIY